MYIHVPHKPRHGFLKKKKMLFSAPNIFLCTVALLSTAASTVILVTLKTTKQFSRSVKFHLGIIALNEILAVWLNLARRIVYVAYTNSKQYETMTIALCKVGLLVGVLCTLSSVLTNVSMNVESLQMLQDPLALENVIFKVTVVTEYWTYC